MWAGALRGLFGLFACYDDARVAPVGLPVFVAVGVPPAILALRVVVAFAPRDVVESEAVPFVAKFEFNLFHLDPSRNSCATQVCQCLLFAGC